MKKYILLLLASLSLASAQTPSEMIELLRSKTKAEFDRETTWRVERSVPAAPKLLSENLASCDADLARLKKDDPSYLKNVKNIEERKAFFRALFSTDRTERMLVKATFFSPTVWQVTDYFVDEHDRLAPGQDVQTVTARGDGLCVRVLPKSGRGSVVDNIPTALDTILRGHPMFSLWKALSNAQPSDIAFNTSNGHVMMVDLHNGNTCKITLDPSTFAVSKTEFFVSDELVRSISLNGDETSVLMAHIDAETGKTVIDMTEKWTVISTGHPTISKAELINFRLPPDLLVDVTTEKVTLTDVPSEHLISGQTEEKK